MNTWFQIFAVIWNLYVFFWVFLHTLKEKRDKQNINNNLAATREATFIPPPSTPIHPLWTAQYLMLPSPTGPAISC
jgi:hypothetical protein